MSCHILRPNLVLFIRVRSRPRQPLLTHRRPFRILILINIRQQNRLMRWFIRSLSVTVREVLILHTVCVNFAQILDHILVTIVGGYLLPMHFRAISCLQRRVIDDIIPTQRILPMRDFLLRLQRLIMISIRYNASSHTLLFPIQQLLLSRSDLPPLKLNSTSLSP